MYKRPTLHKKGWWFMDMFLWSVTIARRFRSIVSSWIKKRLLTSVLFCWKGMVIRLSLPSSCLDVGRGIRVIQERNYIEKLFSFSSWWLLNGDMLPLTTMMFSQDIIKVCYWSCLSLDEGRVTERTEDDFLSISLYIYESLWRRDLFVFLLGCTKFGVLCFL